MPGLTVLVDGYNVLHRQASVVQAASLEAARTALIARVRTFTHARPVHDIVVVFDASGAPLPAERGGQGGGVAVYFAPDADAYVRARVRACRAPRALLVVSDDRAIRDTARACGVECLSAAAFLRQTAARSVNRPPERERLAPEAARRITDELKRHWRL